ncbi:hypothetical protein D3C73_1282120 [compost metagenome]
MRSLGKRTYSRLMLPLKQLELGSMAEVLLSCPPKYVSLQNRPEILQKRLMNWYKVWNRICCSPSQLYPRSRMKCRKGFA